jgi:hypothetical protein
MDDAAQLISEEDRQLLRRVSNLLEEVMETLEITQNQETMREIEEARQDAREGRVRDYSELREELRKTGKIRVKDD